MPGIDASRIFSQYLTPYERDEIRLVNIVYYMNLTANRKAYVLNNISATLQ